MDMYPVYFYVHTHLSLSLSLSLSLPLSHSLSLYICVCVSTCADMHIHMHIDKQPGGWETALAVKHFLKKKLFWRRGAVHILWWTLP